MVYIKRTMSEKLLALSKKFPVVAVLGPRQSGKTTLAKEVFPNHKYLSLEDFATQEFAKRDPYAFFQAYKNEHGMILDEIQKVPELLSYIQGHVDEHQIPGYFIITGSQNFLLHQAISQTLAGRIALLSLLPLSISELHQANLLPDQVEDCMFKGQYPRAYAFDINPVDLYPPYIHTYLERDVRDIRHVQDLALFQKFLGLCAGRIGQLLNVTSLSDDCGISEATTRAWLSLLQASYIIFLLQPYHATTRKRLIKSPKLYFVDTGLTCALLGIETLAQLHTHYARGNIFESFIISELYKQRYNRGLEPNLYFWRDQSGHEFDCISVSGGVPTPIEIKAAKTPSQNYFGGMSYWMDLFPQSPTKEIVIYGGDETQERTAGTLVSWKDVGNIATVINQ
jgi:predicted AAA+ superfamily ATPase